MDCAACFCGRMVWRICHVFADDFSAPASSAAYHACFARRSSLVIVFLCFLWLAVLMADGCWMLMRCLMCCFLMSFLCSGVIHGLCVLLCGCGFLLYGRMASSRAEMRVAVAVSGFVECISGCVWMVSVMLLLIVS